MTESVADRLDYIADMMQIPNSWAHAELHNEAEKVRALDAEIIELKNADWLSMLTDNRNLVAENLHLKADLNKAEAQSADAEYAIGKWLSAALDDPEVCDEFKVDIVNWFTFCCTGEDK